MEPVVIRRSGNLLEISPHYVGILGPALTYTHRVVREGMAALSGFGGSEVYERSLFRIDNEKLYTMQGALELVQKTLDKNNIPWRYEDLRSKTVLEPDYEYLKMSMPELEFRLKQDEVLAHIIAKDHGIILAPTAYGKTFIMLAMAALYPKANIIIASPSLALLRGTYRRMLKITPEVGRIGGGCRESRRVTLCTYASLMRAPIDKCDILLIDECHRVSANDISKTVSNIRSPVKIFGMTATKEGRGDNAELVAEVLIGPVIYKIDYSEAAAAGIISKIKVVMLDIPTNSCNIFSASYRTRIAKKRNCYWRNDVRNRVFAEAVNTLPAKMGIRENPQILILVSTAEHAFRLRRFLPDFEVVYSTLNANLLLHMREDGLVPKDYKPLTASQRDVILKEFEDGVRRKVIATSCWGEGVDFVNLDVLVNASGEASKITTAQWGGRNSRVYSGKEFGLVVDSADQWDQWALTRSNIRQRVYRSLSWEVNKQSRFSS